MEIHSIHVLEDRILLRWGVSLNWSIYWSKFNKIPIKNPEEAWFFFPDNINKLILKAFEEVKELK